MFRIGTPLATLFAVLVHAAVGCGAHHAHAGHADRVGTGGIESHGHGHAGTPAEPDGEPAPGSHDPCGEPDCAAVRPGGAGATPNPGGGTPFAAAVGPTARVAVRTRAGVGETDGGGGPGDGRIRLRTRVFRL